MANALTNLAGPYAGYLRRESPEAQEWLRQYMRENPETGRAENTDPWLSQGDWQGGNNILTQYGASDFAYNPMTGGAVGVDAQGNPLPDSQFSTRTNDDAFWVAAMLAAAGVGGAVGGAGAAGGEAAGGAFSPELTQSAYGGFSGVGAGTAASAAGGMSGSGAGGSAFPAGTVGTAGTAGTAGTGGGMDWAQFGASLVGPALQSYTVGQAADAQAGATGEAIGEQRRQFDLTRGDFAPYREAGLRGLGQYEQQIGQMPTAEEVMAQPGYQFGLQQGQQAIDRKIAAGGGRISGQAIKAAGRFGTDYATTGYGAEYQRRQDRLNRLAALAGIGQSSTASSAAAGQGSTNAISGLLTNQGDNAGQAQLAQGSIWGNAANQVAALYGRQPPAQRNTGVYSPYNIYGPEEKNSGGW